MKNGNTCVYCFFFFKQKTAYEMCGRDWSSDVCSSDLINVTGTLHRGIMKTQDSFIVTLRLSKYGSIVWMKPSVRINKTMNAMISTKSLVRNCKHLMVRMRSFCWGAITIGPRMARAHWSETEGSTIYSCYIIHHIEAQFTMYWCIWLTTLVYVVTADVSTRPYFLWKLNGIPKSKNFIYKSKTFIHWRSQFATWYHLIDSRGPTKKTLRRRG